MSDLAHTPLHDWHAAQGARLVDFAGWDMPVQYTSIVEEHHATRQAVGLFDVSHMGRLVFRGPDSAKFLDSVVTRRVANLKPGQIRYGLVCRDDGGILDDVLVYRLTGDDQDQYQMVVNASNREKIVDWLNQRIGSHDAQLIDQTTKTAMIAVQGPQALPIVRDLVPVDVDAMKYYTCQGANVAGEFGLISRTGYTGEDGCEVIVSAAAAPEVWATLMKAAQAVGGRAAGLGCRDTLRLEAGMPLYGHELSESINPVQAGLAFAYNLKDREFVGRDAIAQVAEQGPAERRVGLRLTGRRVPREDYPIYAGDEQVGHITSGTFSPTFERPLAMGYVAAAHADPGTQLNVDIRGRAEPAEVVDLPFYQRDK